MQPIRTGPQLVCQLALAAFALAGCGGVSVFQGQSPFSVVGSPPAPPPPPPPEAPPSRVEVRDDRIEIKEKIQFEYNKATILPTSFSLMDEIADVIKKNVRIKKISIEGHASSEGNPDHNRKLSDSRAKAVMAYLVGKTVEPARLAAKGWGADKPLADNATEQGREKNRRVEFLIVEQDYTTKKVEVDSSGKEKIVEENKVQGGGAKPGALK
jgi:outer membrane protein OmpA-like peptidoglycan-associated protein